LRRSGEWNVSALSRTKSHFFLSLVVPNLGFGQQPPALKGPEHRILATQGFHCTVANEVTHLSPPGSLPNII
jgi:hypothetical protein